MSMDVESYFDTLCLQNKNIDRDPKYNCAQDIQKYVHFLNKHNIHGTFFVVADFIKDCKEYLLEAIKDGQHKGGCEHHQEILISRNFQQERHHEETGNLQMQ